MPECYHLLGCEQFTAAADLDRIFELTDRFMRERWSDASLTSILRGRVLVALDYCPEFGGLLALQAAVVRLGGAWVAEAMPTTTPSVEDVADEVDAASVFADGLVLRYDAHPQVDLSVVTAAAQAPILFAGGTRLPDPIQALADLYTVRQYAGRTSDLHMTVLGDFGHSHGAIGLASLLTYFPDSRLVVRDRFELPATGQALDRLRQRGLTVVQEDVDQPWHSHRPDVVYLTNHITTPPLTATLLAHLSDRCVVLGPAPARRNQDPAVSGDRRVAGAPQAALGLLLRMGLLATVLAGPDD